MGAEISSLEETSKELFGRAEGLVNKVGEEVTQVEEKPPPFPVFSVTFREPDIVSVVHAADNVLKMMPAVINTISPEALLTTKHPNDHTTEFQVSGKPFTVECANDDQLYIRKVCCWWLYNVHQLGWTLIASADLSLHDDLTSWFFQLNDETKLNARKRRPSFTLVTNGIVGDLMGTGQQSGSQQSDVAMCDNEQLVAVSMHDKDKLQLINGGKTTQRAVKKAVGEHGRDEQILRTGEYSIKIKGKPWEPMSLIAFEDGMRGRRVLIDLFTSFNLNDYEFFGSANLESTADTIFFKKMASVDKNVNFGMFSLNGKDKIRMIDMSVGACDAVKRCIEQDWHKGLKEVIEYKQHNCVEFKLKGYPWCCKDEEAMKSRRLLCRLLGGLRSQSWAVKCALDMSRAEDDKSVFIVNSCEAAEYEHICVAPVGTDRIHLLNAERTVMQEIKDSVKTLLRESLTTDCYEWTLSGDPWSPVHEKDGIMARHVIAVFLAVLKKKQWQLVTCADISAQYEKRIPVDVHTLFFQQPVNQPEALTVPKEEEAKNP